MRFPLRTREIAALLLLALVASACSVPAPRGSVALAVDAPGDAQAAGPLEEGLGAIPVDPPSAIGTAASPTVASTGSTGATSGSGSGASPTTGAAAPRPPGGGGAPQPAEQPGPQPGAQGSEPGQPPAADEAPPTAADATPGVHDDRLVVSIIAGFTGPLSAMVANAYDALETWQEDVNEAGGIHGRRVELVRVDHGETADGGVAACMEARSNGSYVAMVPQGIEANVTAVSCLDAAGVPTLYFAGTRDPAWQVAFSDVVTSDRAGTVLSSYVAGSLAAGSRRIGVLYVNQLAYQATAAEFTGSARALGLDVVDPVAVEPNQATFTSELVQLQQAGVEVLVISATAEAIGILRDARAIGFTPQVTGWGFTFDFITAAARSLFDGVTGLRTGATVDTAAYEAYAARMDARGRGRDRTVDTEGFLAYGHSLLLGELLTLAGPQPTRTSFVTGAETLHGYDNGILPPITYGPGDHVGTEAAFASICCNADSTWQGQGPAREQF